MRAEDGQTEGEKDQARQEKTRTQKTTHKRTREQPVVRGKQQRQERRRSPVPMADRSVAAFKRTAVNEVLRKESRQQTDKCNYAEQRVAREQPRRSNARGIFLR